MNPELHAEALEQVFQDLAEVARSGPSRREFSKALVHATLAVTGGHGAGVWLLSGVGDDEVQGVFHMHLEDLLSNEETRRTHEHVLRLAISNKRVQKVPLPSHSCLLIACPLSRGADLRGVLALVLPIDIENVRLSSTLEALAGLCELAEEFFHVSVNRDLSERLDRIARLEEFSYVLQQRQHHKELCFEVAARLPNVARCDRVLVLQRKHGSMRLVAVTGVDTIDSRADTTVAAERLAAMVASTNEPLWEGLPQTNGGPALPPQLEDVLSEYSETCHPRALLVHPLTTEAEPNAFGALILEWSKHSPDEHQRYDALRALDHVKYSIRRTSRPAWLGVRLSRWAGRLVATGVVLALLTWFFLHPVPFNLEASGSLQPKNRLNIYAPADGEVARLFVRHGDSVQEGHRLFRIRSLALERDYAELDGRRREIQTRLKVIEVETLSTPRTFEDQQAAKSLAAEEQRLREQLRGLEKTASIIEEQLEQLVVKSPRKGKVVSWDLRHDWAQRQVRRGQPVLRVDDWRGPWELELALYERRYGHLRQQEENGKVQVTFRLASDPEQVRTGFVEAIGNRAEAAIDGQPYLPVTVQVPSKHLPKAPRAGATVIARLHCGQRSRAFVWFHQFAEYVRQRLFL